MNRLLAAAVPRKDVAVRCAALAWSSGCLSSLGLSPSSPGMLLEGRQSITSTNTKILLNSNDFLGGIQHMTEAMITVPVLDGALCAEVSAELFFPETNEGFQVMTNELRAVCGRCPALAACRDWGIRHERHGIWGGLSPTERKRERARLGIQVETPNYFVLFPKLMSASA